MPTILLVLLSGFGVVNQAGVASDASGASDHVELALATQDLINALQRERALTSGLLGGFAPYRVQLDAQRRATDQNRTALDQLLASAPDGQGVQAALDRLSGMAGMRASVDSGQMRGSDALSFYTSGIVALSAATAGTGTGQRDLELRQGLDALSVLGDAKEALALERGQLDGVFAQNRFLGDQYQNFTETRAVKVDALARFRQVATADRVKALDDALRSPEATSAHGFEDRALRGAGGQRLGVRAPQWSAAMGTVGSDLRAIQRDIGSDVRARAATVQRDANLLLTLYSIAAAVTLLLAAILWIYMFRSIVRPLRVLTAEAHDVAERRLPEAVDLVQSSAESGEVVLKATRQVLARREDEFAEVADALDNLQHTAFRLATQQAVMRRNTAESLANLGRRNQNLVRRQLGFISALERDENDPGALGNLFELDHLATRMRRNAESLLVLVGEHSPRRWSNAVQIGDVLRSAFAEVEEYRRVTLRRAEDSWVRGGVAAELSHLLAELVENALTFSPTGQEVEVLARVSGNQYHIAIIDQGIGMTREAMATANARLRGEQSFLVTPTRDLGHYVVGKLAQQLGVSVWLHDSPLNGVTARVVIPTDLLAAPEQPGTKPIPVVPPARPAMQAPAPPHPAAPQRSAEPAASNGAGPAGTAVAVAEPPEPLGAPVMPPPEHWPPRAATTTRNGLVKRERGGARPPRPAPAPVAPDPGPSLPLPPERSPQQVRSMLDSFRSGFHGTGDSR